VLWYISKNILQFSKIKYDRLTFSSGHCNEWNIFDSLNWFSLQYIPLLLPICSCSVMWLNHVCMYTFLSAYPPSFRQAQCGWRLSGPLCHSELFRTSTLRIHSVTLCSWSTSIEKSIAFEQTIDILKCFSDVLRTCYYDVHLWSLLASFLSVAHSWPFKRWIKSHLLSAGITSSPFSPR